MTGVVQAFEKALSGAFLSPLLLAFLGLIPIVILLYLLKLRRTEIVISSTLLWLKSLEDLTANAPFQRLRKNLLLLLQILVLLLVVGGLGRPYFRAHGIAGKNLCLLIDRSASMQTLEGERPRLELAKEKALELIRDLNRGDKAMLVTFAETSDVRCELTDDRVRLRQAIEAITAADTATKLRDAFLVAHSLRLTVPDLHAVIISDGNIVDLDELQPRTYGAVEDRDLVRMKAAQGYDLTFLEVGESTDNAGIVAFSTRTEDERSETFVLVHNASRELLESTVTLSFDKNGDSHPFSTETGTKMGDSPHFYQTLAVEEISVPAGEDKELVFTHPELGKGILRAELDHSDALAVDNVASLALRPASKIRVLLAAAPNAVSTYFVQRAVLSDPRVELSTIAPADYVLSNEFDVTIFDGFAPPTPPEGTLVFLNAVPSLEAVCGDAGAIGSVGTVASASPQTASTGVLENPPVIAMDSQHPLMRFNLNMSNVGVRKAQKLELPEGARTVVSTTGAALIADVSCGGRQIVVVAFDIADSDWPLNLSFPLFFQNLTAWAPRAALGSESYVSAGKPLTIPSNDVSTQAAIALPDGASENIELDPVRPVFYSHTEKAGVYTVTAGDRSDDYAVDLLDKLESSVGPAESLAIGRGEFEALREPIRQNIEMWRWFLLAGIFILVVEWWIYCRRAWI